MWFGIWCLFGLALLFCVVVHGHSELVVFAIMLICLFYVMIVIAVRFINSVDNTLFYIFARRCGGFGICLFRFAVVLWLGICLFCF